MHQVFRHLNADESRSDDQARLGPAGQFSQTVGILQVAQCENPWRVDAGNRRAEWRGAWRQHESVVCLRVFTTGIQVPNGDGLGAAIDRDRFRPDSYIDAIPFDQTRLRCNQQLVPFRDHPSDVIRQAAVREGRIMPAFQHHDLGLLAQAPNPSRGGGASGHAANNHDLHRVLPICLSH